MIGFYVHHQGSGHLTRAVEIARACTDPVVGFSTAPAPPGWPGRWVGLPDDAPAAAADADPQAGGVLHWAPLGDHPYADRMHLLATALIETRPSLVFVDVSVEVTLLARILGIPVAVAAMRGDRLDRPHRLAYDAARVLVAPWPEHLPEPDLPAPDAAKTVYTGGISRFDTAGADHGGRARGVRAHGDTAHDDTAHETEGTASIGSTESTESIKSDDTVYAATGGTVQQPDDLDGFDGSVATGSTETTDAGDREVRSAEGSHGRTTGTRAHRVFVLWGRGGGDWPEEVWSAARDATPGWSWEVGAPSDLVRERLAAADVVVTHAGQNAVAEVAAARRPAVVVALPRPHGEQAATLAALARADLAETIDASADTDDTPPQIDWPTVLDRAVARGGQGWATWSDGFGAHRAARALEAAARDRRIAPRTAVITVVHGRHDHLTGMITGLARGSHLPERLVVVAMDDPQVAGVCAQACAGTGLVAEVVSVASADLGLPLAHARNRGAARAADLGCEVLVFLDVDCIPGTDLVRRYAEAVTTAGGDTPTAEQPTAEQPTAEQPTAETPTAEAPTVWSGPVTYLPPPPPEGYDLDGLPDLADPHPARPAPAPGEVVLADDLRLFWSLSFALTHRDFVRIGGFCEEYVGYGGEDTDFAMTLQERGGRLVWLGGAEAYHQHHPTSSPPVGHLVDIVRNANLFARRWGRHPMEGWLDAFADAGLASYDATLGQWRVTGEVPR